MQSVTFGQCICGAWKDAMLMVVRKPLMLFILFVILACINYVRSILPNATPAGSSDWQRAGISVASLLYTLLHCAVIFGLSVQVMRQSLLSKSAPGLSAFFDESFWRYVGLNFLTGGLGGVVLIVMAGIIGSIRPNNYDRTLLFAWGLLGLIAACVFFFICIRQTVLYCHVAVGGRAGWRIAWSDTRGHFWTIWATLILAGLPVWAFTLFSLVGIYTTRGLVSTSIWAFPTAILSALGGIFSIAVYAASSAWVYRRFASNILNKG